eukprot:CAMPEP_0176082204 /NCGR_PEP_ID=MMETSP0120_2-20121206/41119_1 /TAXON_ID=160619 /ORGANISM="Kryptoperidinium foliaceum, Strain CCMP 1326" /LENGTH=458 /DNA_ID=CAMNT_0017415971 /DNA_START=328 /DNA_END=1704 /DNA_ORIENTATION=-
MTECIDIPDGEQVSKLGTNIFVATAIQDQVKTRASGATDCSTLKVACEDRGGTFAAARCECTEDHQGLVSHAEDTHVHLNHGYIVSWPSGSKYRGQDKAQAQVKHSSSEPWTTVDGEPGKMVTVIRDHRGQPCKVGADTPGGAKDTWYQSDVSADGLAVTLRELLSCAEVSLDAPEPTLASGLATEEGQPRARIAGMNIHLDFSYHNAEDSGHIVDGFDGTVCVLTVSTDPRWNSATQMAYSAIPDARTGAGAYRSRKAYGISFTFQAKGSFSKFDAQNLVTVFVNALVILALPAAIVQFLALNGLGALSKVYKRAQAQVLSISRQFSGLTARMLAGAAAFETLCAENDDKATIHGPLFLQRLEAAFHKQLNNGELEAEEFKTMCDQVLQDMDTGSSSGVSLDEFLAAFSSEECLRPKDMVKFFDKSRSRSILEVIFSASQPGRQECDIKKVHVEPSD